jgi:hypothetical protein
MMTLVLLKPLGSHGAADAITCRKELLQRNPDVPMPCGRATLPIQRQVSHAKYNTCAAIALPFSSPSAQRHDGKPQD